MKRLILSGALILCGLTGASATTHYVTTYRDQIRPHGHVRSDAIYNANIEACYRATGASRTEADPPAFKSCMLKHGWRLVAQRLVRDPGTQMASRPAAEPDYSSPTVTVTLGGSYTDEELQQQEEENDEFHANIAAAGQGTQDAINAANQAAAIAAANP